MFLVCFMFEGFQGCIRRTRAA